MDNYGNRIKRLRIRSNQTQDEFATELGVTRQAVSNWENHKNPPDIEILIALVEKYGISLDELVLGESKNDKEIAEKLIRESNESRRTRNSLRLGCIGTVLLLIGVMLLVIKSFSVEYIDDDGIIHENFFLIPLAFVFFISGIITFSSMGIYNIMHLLKNHDLKKKVLFYLILILEMITLLAGIVLILFVANGGGGTLVLGLTLLIGSIVSMVIRTKRLKNCWADKASK